MSESINPSITLAPSSSSATTSPRSPQSILRQKHQRTGSLAVSPVPNRRASVVANKKPSTLVIGIDLGTTHSCVAVYQCSKAEIIVNEQGNRTTPSQVAFTQTECIVGDAAKQQGVSNSQNTIYDSKRLIGRKYCDDEIKADAKQWPFTVVDDEGVLKYKVQHNDKTLLYLPEEISAMILRQMKETAERTLGENINLAVVTVPAYFNNAQRQATKDAAEIAGLTVLRVLNEPTAAALAFGLHLKVYAKKGLRYTLVFDLGGGTFDVSVVAIELSQIRVLSTVGNTHLGGADFDNRIVDHLCTEFRRKYNRDCRLNVKALRRLRIAAEQAKRTLSSVTVTSVEIDALYDGYDLTTSLTRACFEELNFDLFTECMTIVDQALQDAQVSKGQIDEILMVGGSSRIPKLAKMITTSFRGKSVNNSINPDEAVALGAAIQGAMLSEHSDQKRLRLPRNSCTKDVSRSQDQEGASTDVVLSELLMLSDVIPLSLGIRAGVTNRMRTFIERNTTIPVRRRKVRTTVNDFQKEITFDICEGERVMAADNHFIGQVKLTGIESAHRGVPKIEVVFDVNADGILNVFARDLVTQAQTRDTIAPVARLKREQIDKMIADAKCFKNEDEQHKKRCLLLNRFEACLYGAKRRSETEQKTLGEERCRRVQITFDEAIHWLDSNRNCSDRVLNSKLNSLKREFDTIFRVVDFR